MMPVFSTPLFSCMMYQEGIYFRRVQMDSVKQIRLKCYIYKNGQFYHLALVLEYLLI